MKSKLLLYLICFVYLFSVEAKTNEINPFAPPFLKATQIAFDIPTFTFSFNNALSNKDFVLVAKNIHGEETVLQSNLSRCSDGQLVRGSQLYKLTLCSLGPGEAVTIKAYAKNGTESAEVRFIPRPMRTIQNGYTLTMEVLDPCRKSFSLGAEGFAPYEEVQLFSYSGDRKIWNRVRADKEGRIYCSLLHKFYEEKEGGKTYLELQGRNGKAHLVYPWGSSYEREWKDVKRFERFLMSGY